MLSTVTIMKKLSAAVLLLMILAFSAQSQTYLSEDFSSGTFPPTGWSIYRLPAQWSASNSSNAGGIAPELMFTYINSTDSSRFISPAVNLTGLTTVTLMFNHFYDDYTGTGPVVGVATRSASGPWHSVWEISPTSNVGPEIKILNISNADVGSSTFQFCFYIKGNLYNIDYWYVDDVILFTPYPTDASLAGVTLPKYAAPNTPLTLKGVVKNLGMNAITSYDVAYTIDGGPANVYQVTGVNLQLGGTDDFTHNVPLLFDVPGSHTVQVYLQNINGSPDPNPSNDTVVREVGVVSSVPDRKLFAEEATGGWCGWCVRGICFMDYMAETYPDQWIGVAVHNGDPMVYAPYDGAISQIIPGFQGYPSCTIDRVNNIDPQDLETYFQTMVTEISPAKIFIEQFDYNPTTRVVNFNLRTEFVYDITDEVRFCAVISEDSVHGTTTAWNQANYYAGGSNGPMCGFESLPSTIPAADMYYQHVARVILSGPFGTPNSITPPTTNGTSHTWPFTYTLPAGWNYDKLHFIGLLINSNTKEVLNATDVITSHVGIKNPPKDIKLSVYPNPFTNSTSVVFTLDKQANVNVKLLNPMGQLVYSNNGAQFAAGENKIVIDGQFKQGLYLLEVTVGSEKYTTKVTVVR